MIEEWYDPAVTRRTEEFYGKIRAWGIQRRDVTVIGGAAVRELVKPPHSVPTQDIDLVLQTQAALDDFQTHFPAWGISWRRKGRTTFKECRFIDRAPYPPIIDVFTTDLAIGERLFTMQKASNLEPEAQGQSFLPTLEYLLRTKLRAVHHRDGETAQDKRAKDLLDIHLLVFRNAAETPSTDLRARLPLELRRAAATGFIEPAIAFRPQLEADYRRIQRWLITP